GRVVPGDESADVFALENAVDERAQRRFRLRLVVRGGEVRHGDAHALRRIANLDRRRSRVADRLLEVEDTALAGEAGHEMLRALEAEIPAQVREAEQIRQ